MGDPELIDSQVRDWVHLKTADELTMTVLLALLVNELSRVLKGRKIDGEAVNDLDILRKALKAKMALLGYLPEGAVMFVPNEKE